MVMSREAFTLFSILSKVSFEKESMPVAIRTMYFWPSIARQPVQRLVQRVEDVGLGKCRGHVDFVGQHVHAFLDLLLVLREIGHDVRIQVEGHHGHVVLGPQLLRKGPGRVQRLHSERPMPRAAYSIRIRAVIGASVRLKPSTFCSTPSS